MDLGVSEAACWRQSASGSCCGIGGPTLCPGEESGEVAMKCLRVVDKAYRELF